jgi:hypothetical protein
MAGMDLILLRINKTTDFQKAQMQKNFQKKIAVKLSKTVIKQKKVLKICHGRPE